MHCQTQNSTKHKQGDNRVKTMQRRGIIHLTPKHSKREECCFSQSFLLHKFIVFHINHENEAFHEILICVIKMQTGVEGRLPPTSGNSKSLIEFDGLEAHFSI